MLAVLRERGAAPVMDIAKAMSMSPKAAGAALKRLRLRGLALRAGTTARGPNWGDGGAAGLWEAVPHEGE